MIGPAPSEDPENVAPYPGLPVMVVPKGFEPDERDLRLGYITQADRPDAIMWIVPALPALWMWAIDDPSYLLPTVKAILSSNRVLPRATGGG
jgi:hypothetical protein